MNIREFKVMSSALTPLTGPLDPLAELVNRASGYQYLLAYSDDGVIWGRVQEGKLQTADQAWSNLPVLRAATLQEARLFGPQGEFYLWRTATGWVGRLITDDVGAETDVYDEAVLLWGTRGQNGNGFALVQEADLGLRHAPPVQWPTDQARARPFALVMRHYVNFDDAGAAFVALSRFVTIA